ncbi:MAG: lactate permease LctP family transporter [Lachnospiraceae bacterium]|nr:lactate permease LctP family transporter [Lachnospiraceae bacterium]
MLFVKFILGLIPIIWLIIALSGLKMPGYKACSIAIVFAGVVAIAFKHMRPIDAGTAIIEGALTALWPIILVIIAALFTYNITLETGAMDKIKGMLASVSEDKRVLGLIIGWGFGCFMEGMAGFGTAVAIPASILIALGFDAVPTVVALLIVNSTPTAFGSVGVPTTSMAAATGIDAVKLSAATGRIELLLMFLSPFFLVFVIGGGMKALKGKILPITLISSLAFVVPNFIIANVVGPELPNIIGSILSMIITILVALKSKDSEVPEEYKVQGGDKNFSITTGEGVKAWSPFILIFILLLFTSKLFPAINTPLSSISSSVTLYSGEGAAPNSFTWINTPGVWIIIAGIIGGLIQGAGLGKILGVFGTTIKNNVKTIITICAVLATAKIMVHSGMTTDVADALVTVTKKTYPFFAPWVGVLGAFVTGSGTNTNVLFGPLQQAAAQQLHLPEEWLCSANALGGGVGKMISPSNLALSCAAAGLAGRESEVMGKVMKYCVIFAVVGGIVCIVGSIL